MYRNIFVPVDNSAHSNRAADTAIALGRAFEAKLTGCHVYAARMHDYRFRQMEYTLPEEYLVEQELSRQRKIHDSLITMGLELISDCYLEDLDKKAQAAGLACERRMMDGKHSTELLREIENGHGYDLVVLGAVGIGRTKDTQLGSVAARVTAKTSKDTWVIKHVPKEGDPERDTILVGVDGSPESFGALMTAVDLARAFGKKVEVVGVYDPYLHYAVFKGIVEVLTDRAAKVFRFEEQNQLHEEIIDTGLAQIYQSHVNVAETMAREAGVEVTKTLLDGKAFQKLLDHARKVEPWLLVVGRVGVHRQDDEEGLGSNTENLLRLAPCDVLLTTRRETPALDLKAEESIHWTPEAEERMVRVPEQVKGIARTAILRLALEKGHSVVSSDLVTEAMERFMPKRSAAMTEKLAEALAIDKARRESVAICRGCGVAAKVPDPAVCTVCGGREFETVEPEVIDAIAAAEGGTEEETTYDGRKLTWTQEAKKALRAIDDRYQRRRAKARIEKAAHARRIPTVTLELANRYIEEETGVLYRPAEAPAEGGRAAAAADAIAAAQEGADRMREAAVAKGLVAAPRPEEPAAGASAAEPGGDEVELKIHARDDKGHPLVSRFEWTADAIPRILRVPHGFMRDRTQRRIEELAAERGATTIDLALVEEGIEHGRRMMAEMLGQAEAAKAEAAKAGEAKAANGGGGNGQAAPGSGQAAGAEACPVEHEPAPPRPLKPALNEAGVMGEIERRRYEIEAAGEGQA
ncbi:MAG TPA: universal stress protein [Thermoanaerobaculia bacterium]